MIVLRDDVGIPEGFDVSAEPGQHVLVAVESAAVGARPVGAVLARFGDNVARVARVWVAPDATGVEDDLVEAVRHHYGERGAGVVSLAVMADQPALHRSVHGAPVLGVYMTKAVSPTPPAFPPGFGHRPMRADEYVDWVDEQVSGYAEDSLARSGGDRAVAEREAQTSFRELLPDGLGTADTALLVLTHADAPVGFLWLRHHWERARDTTFVFDVAVDEAYRGRGLGRAAMAVGEHLALAAGDTTYGLHVFGFNVVARRLYESYGFTAQLTSYDVTRRP